jgi:spermidine/putrescine transport system ATP-binding protein
LETTAIDIVDVCKRFGSATALNRITLQIKQGEFFSLLGPSGCGKTTLLRMIAGFETPTEGKIVVAGKDMSAVPPHKRPVNMVFQSYALFPHLSVFDNVAFGLRAKKLCPAGEIPERVKSALSMVRLGEFIDRFPAQLSGGQQQRVSLARAIVNRPSVLLLDEPLSALDLKIRQEMQEELSRLQRELGITFVMVTHDQGEALALSTRIAVMYAGDLEQVGAPSEIYEHPKTAFVANFIGQSNLLDGQIMERSGNFVKVRVNESMVLTVSDNPDVCASDSQDAVIWIRSDVLKMYKSEAGSGSLPESTVNAETNRFAVKITNRSYQGTSVDYHLKTQTGGDLRATCAAANDFGFQVGDTAYIELSANAALILPPRSSKSSTCAAPASKPVSINRQAVAV